MSKNSMRSTVQCNKEWLSWGVQQGFVKKKKKRTVYEEWQEMESIRRIQKQ